MKDLKAQFAHNLILLRKQHNLTQTQLAERLNYSDKSISKWERKEALPDIVTLKEIADMFDTTVDCLIQETSSNKAPLIKQTPSTDKPFLTSLFYSLIVWVVATLYFAISHMVNPDFLDVWKVFILAIPVFYLTLFIFSILNKKRVFSFFFLSSFLWTVALTLFILVYIPNNWLFFIIPIPVQIGIVLGYRIF